MNSTLTIARPASPQILVKKAPWRPALFQKQLDVVFSKTRFDLVSGPRLSGKSRAVTHSIIKHAWDTPRARVGMFAKSIRNAKVGAWDDLVGMGMSEWLAARLKSPHTTFDWVKEPGVDGATRMSYFRVKNWWGGTSECQLHSLDYDGDVEQKLLDTRFSMIVFLELQKFESPSIFNISILQLRMDGLPASKHRWLSDTNPPDSGTDHFAHKIWFVDRVQEDPPETVKTEEEIVSWREYQKDFSLFQFEIDDNIYADPVMIRDLKNAYRDDPAGWNRFILGKWEKAYSSKEYHFSGCYRPEIHVAGDVSGRRKDDWQVLKPSEECTTLLTGWDLGDINHSFGLWEPVIMENDEVGFIKLAELVWIGVQEPLSDFIYEALELIDTYEAMCKRKIDLRSWSDTSSWRFSARSEDHDAVLIDRLSEGKVKLLAATRAKQHQSVRRRIKLYQDLLKQNRILISAQCFATQDMLSNLRSGRMETEVIAKGSPQKHVFDSDSYMLFSELFCQAWEGSPKSEKPKQSTVLSIPL